jgi:hypothetical protein
VVPEEVEQVVFSHPRYLTAGRHGSVLIYGRTDSGRALLVVLSESGDGTHFVVTAKNMTKRERLMFERMGDERA